MKEAIGMVVGVVITLVSLVTFIDNTFVPYREQQAFMAQANENMLEKLNGELNNATTGGSVSVSGSTVKSTIDANVGKSNVEIYVNGTKWDGKASGSSNIRIEESSMYTKTTEQPSSSNGNKIIYRFQKQS